MAFDPMKYRMRDPFALTLYGADVTQTYTTANLLKKYTPGQYAHTYDPLWGYRIFKLVKNLSNATIAKGDLMSYVAAASVGTVTDGSKTSITTSGMTANDFEWQMVTVADDAGGAGAAPEGESSLVIGNTTTHIELHPDYAFTAAVAASDSVYVVYINGVEDATAGDERGFGHGSVGVAGVAYGAAADNEWFWILQRGWAIAKNTAELTATYNLIAGEALVNVQADGAQELEVGQVTVTQFAGTEASFGTVFVDVFNTICTTGTP
jgi:hypothetical protein